MPTSPRSPLSFRTAGFPQYGWKAGLSDGAFPECRRLKPAPGIHQPASGLLPPFVHLGVATIFPYCARSRTRSCTAIVGRVPTTQGASLGSRLFCPGPSSLNRPHPPHSQAHHDFTARRLIRAVFAVRERPGDPRVVPGFRCSFRPDMPSSLTPGSSTPTCPEFLMPTLAFAEMRSARHSQLSRKSASRGVRISWLHWFAVATACQVARPPARIGPDFPGQRGLLHPGFRRVGHPSRRWI